MVWVQAELGGRALTSGWMWACPTCRDGFHLVADEDSIIVGGLVPASGMCARETRFLSTCPETRPSLTLLEERVAEASQALGVL